MADYKDDVYFHGITERSPSKNEACKSLVQGLVKYAKHFNLLNDPDPTPGLGLNQELMHKLDRWCEHDAKRRNNFFDNYFCEEDPALDEIITEAIKQLLKTPAFF